MTRLLVSAGELRFFFFFDAAADTPDGVDLGEE